MTVASGDAAVRACAADAGAAAAELVAPVHDDAALAAQFAELLGLDGARGGDEAQRSEAADVVVAHLQPAGGTPWQPSACGALAAALDSLVQKLAACPDVAPRLYLVLLLGRSEAVHAACVPSTLPPHLAHMRPEQSFVAQRLGGLECVSQLLYRRLSLLTWLSCAATGSTLFCVCTAFVASSAATPPPALATPSSWRVVRAARCSQTTCSWSLRSSWGELPSMAHEFQKSYAQHERRARRQRRACWRGAEPPPHQRAAVPQLVDG